MPWFEGRRCEECRYEWDHIDLSESISVGTIEYDQAETRTLYCCPQCYFRLWVQREWDGNSWRHWCRAVRHVPGGFAGDLFQRVVERISAILASRRTIYQPVLIDLGQVDCTRCGCPLVMGSVERPRAGCPKCGSRRSASAGNWGHVVLVDESFFGPEQTLGAEGSELGGDIETESVGVGGLQGRMRRGADPLAAEGVEDVS